MPKYLSVLKFIFIILLYLHYSVFPLQTLLLHIFLSHLLHLQVHRDNKDGTVATGPGISVDRTVWSIIRSHLSKETSNAECVEKADEDGEGVQQIIYVTYQDPDDPSEAKTLHIVDDMRSEAKNDVCGNAFV